MKEIIELIQLGREIGGLAADLLKMRSEGQAPRVGDVLSADSRAEMTKRVKDARATLKYGSLR